MKRNLAWALLLASLVVGGSRAMFAADEVPDFSPRPEEQQVPHAMRSAMKDQPTIRVGQRDADLIGSDYRALQAMMGQ